MSAYPANLNESPALRVAKHVDGPTLCTRELAFGRGIASPDRAPTCLSRSSRTAVSALSGFFVLLLSAVALTGCGGSDAPVAAPAPAPTSTPGSVSAPGAAPGSPAGSPSGSSVAVTPGPGADVQVAPGAQVRATEATPRKFAAYLGKRPIMILMYQPGSNLDMKVASQFVRVAKAQDKDDIAIVVVTPADYKLYQDIPENVGVLSAPSISIISRSGELQNYWTGYVDAELISKSLALASSAKPAEVTAFDAPPAPVS